MNKKQPNPIDVHVGSRVRLRRMMLGMSQEKLGLELGITFQQIQKYEKGTNRIGGSRMAHIARVLSVPVGFFFEDAPGNVPVGDTVDANLVPQFLTTHEGIQLNKAFIRIRDPRARRKIVELCRIIAGDDPDEVQASGGRELPDEEEPPAKEPGERTITARAADKPVKWRDWHAHA